MIGVYVLARLNELYGSQFKENGVLGIDGIKQCKNEEFSYNYHFRHGNLVEIVSAFKATEQTFVGRRAIFLGYTTPHRFARVAVLDEDFDLYCILLLHPEQLEIFGRSKTIKREIVMIDFRKFTKQIGLLDRKALKKLRKTLPDLPFPEAGDDRGGFSASENYSELIRFLGAHAGFRIATESKDGNVENRVRLIDRQRYFLTKDGDTNLNLRYDAAGGKSRTDFAAHVIDDYELKRERVPTGFTKFLLQTYILQYPEIVKELTDYEVCCIKEETFPDKQHVPISAGGANARLQIIKNVIDAALRQQ